MSIRFAVLNRLPAGNVLFCAAALVGALSAVSVQPAAAQTGICPPSDPDTCLAECYRHKRNCWRTCTERKRQCIGEARLEAQACRMECRENADVEDPGLCRRRCVATALRTAIGQCKLGRPVCLKECNPRTCRRRCDVPTVDVAPTCKPPVDLECLGECAREFRGCLERVRTDGRACAAGCSDLSGEERRVCLRECAHKTHEGAAHCTSTFRECIGDCRDAVEPVDPVVDPSTD